MDIPTLDLLHELHAASLGGDGAPMEPAMALALAASFGSAERWRDTFSALSRSFGGDSVWVLMSWRPQEGRLVNQAVADPTQVNAQPILALDMRKLTGRVDAFLANIDWAAVYRRYQAAVHAASEPFAVKTEDVANAALLDVRREGVFVQARTMIPGARWCDPAKVGEWAGELPNDRPVVVYCVRGHEVSRATALRLRATGVDARFLYGGIDSWVAAGRPLADKPPSAAT